MKKTYRVRVLIFMKSLVLALTVGWHFCAITVNASSSVNFLPLATYSFSFGNPVNIIGGKDSAGNKVFFVLDKGDIFGGIPATISAVNVSGAIVASLSSITNPTNIALNGSSLYVTDSSHKYKYTFGTTDFTQAETSYA